MLSVIHAKCRIYMAALSVIMLNVILVYVVAPLTKLSSQMFVKESACHYEQLGKHSFLLFIGGYKFVKQIILTRLGDVQRYNIMSISLFTSLPFCQVGV